MLTAALRELLVAVAGEPQPEDLAWRLLFLGALDLGAVVWDVGLLDDLGQPLEVVTALDQDDRYLGMDVREFGMRSAQDCWHSGSA